MVSASKYSPALDKPKLVHIEAMALNSRTKWKFVGLNPVIISLVIIATILFNQTIFSISIHYESLEEPISTTRTESTLDHRAGSSGLSLWNLVRPRTIVIFAFASPILMHTPTSERAVTSSNHHKGPPINGSIFGRR